ncbi:MAG TPA: hypothetical protein VLB44_04435 [Kofleriaceae bacterium]|nr:hypothetical protein [Kofleriaceae bacterium]
MKLKELEKRLKSEPENLGLRVQVAGLMREAGRSVEAVELYRSVALAYRDQGRTQQAIAVCRSILEIAPDDAACLGLIAMLQGRGTPSRPPPVEPPPPPVHITEPVSAPSVPPLRQPEPYDINSMDPARRSSLDETPLPKPVPYHVSDPTSRPVKVSPADLEATSASQAGPKTGLAEAARRISGMISNTESRPGIPNKEMDLAAELDTRLRPKLESDQVRKLDALEVEGSDVDERTSPLSMNEDLATDRIDMMTPPPRGSDDALTPSHRPSEDALTPPPLDGRVPTEVRAPPRSTAQPTRPPKIVSIPPKTSSGKTPSRPPLGTEPPVRPALPHIPKSRDSDEELTKPRDKPSLDDELED